MSEWNDESHALANQADLTDVFNNDFACLQQDGERDTHNKQNHSDSEFLLKKDDEAYNEWNTNLEK